MNTDHTNGRTVATNHYSNNIQAAKSASAFANSMKMVNKPLFLVAAAMLMLIFFAGTAHAQVIQWPQVVIVNPSSGTMYPATNQLITYTASNIPSGYSITTWEVTAANGIDASNTRIGPCTSLAPFNSGSNTLVLTYGETFSCDGSQGSYTFTINSESAPFTVYAQACNGGNCACNGSCTIVDSNLAGLSFVPPLSTPGLTMQPHWLRLPELMQVLRRH